MPYFVRQQTYWSSYCTKCKNPNRLFIVTEEVKERPLLQSLSHSLSVCHISVCIHPYGTIVGVRKKKRAKKRRDYNVMRGSETSTVKQNESRAIAAVVVLWPLWLRITVRRCTPSIPGEQKKTGLTALNQQIHHSLPAPRFTQTGRWERG